MVNPAATDIIVDQKTEHYIDGRKIDVKKAVTRDQAPAPSRSECKKLFVGAIAPDVSDQDLKDAFSKYGQVKEASIMLDRSTQKPRGFGLLLG